MPSLAYLDFDSLIKRITELTPPSKEKQKTKFTLLAVDIEKKYEVELIAKVSQDKLHWVLDEVEEFDICPLQ